MFAPLLFFYDQKTTVSDKLATYENTYVNPENTKAMTTEKIKVSPLTGVVLSQILIACTYEYVNRYTAIMKDRNNAMFVSMIDRSPFRECVVIMYMENNRSSEQFQDLLIF